MTRPPPWARRCGRAALITAIWIVMHQRYFAAYADKAPYLVAYVKLAEGPFMITTVADPPEDLRGNWHFPEKRRPSPGFQVKVMNGL